MKLCRVGALSLAQKIDCNKYNDKLKKKKKLPRAELALIHSFGTCLSNFRALPIVISRSLTSLQGYVQYDYCHQPKFFFFYDIVFARYNAKIEFLQSTFSFTCLLPSPLDTVQKLNTHKRFRFIFKN